jgi:hypothetical protein
MENMENQSTGAVKFPSGTAYRTKGGKRKTVPGLKEALAEEAGCGCGIECGCYSYLTLKDYNSTDGTESFVALAVIDGELLIGSIDTVKAAIDAAKNV